MIQDCSGSAARVKPEPNGVDYSCCLCGRYFKRRTTTTRAGLSDGARLLPRHKASIDDELDIGAESAAEAGLVGGLGVA